MGRHEEIARQHQLDAAAEHLAANGRNGRHLERPACSAPSFSLTYYLQQTLGYSPLVTGVAFLPISAGSAATSNLALFTATVTSYLAAHLASARLIGRQALTQLALAHGYDTAFWWIAGIFAAGAVICGALLRNGPLTRTGTAAPATSAAATAGPVKG